MRKVFADTSVLFPFSVMDLLLTLSENRLLEPVWTDELLDKWARVIVREHHRTAESAAAITDAIREHFGDLRIDPSLYRDLIATMPGPDPDDHVHSAAAIAVGVDALLTWDTKGFPVEPLAARGLRVTDPDTYLSEIATEFAEDVAHSITELARTKTRPPMTSDDILDALTRAGLAAFPELVRDSL